MLKYYIQTHKNIIIKLNKTDKTHKQYTYKCPLEVNKQDRINKFI